MTPLKNAKHEAVIQHFVADKNRVGWRAYSAVYKGSSQRAAETAWSRLLKRAEFAARLKEFTGEIADRVVSSRVMDLNEVLVELSKVGRSSIKDMLVDGDNTVDVVQSLRDLPDEHAAAIQELTIETYVEGHGEEAREVKRVKLKLHPKTTALSELRRHYEPNKHEITGKGGKPIETKDVGEPRNELEIARRIAFLLERGARAAAKAPPAKAKRVKSKGKAK